MKRMILLLAHMLTSKFTIGCDLFDAGCIFDGDSCYSLSMIDNDRIQWWSSINRYSEERNATIDLIPDSIMLRIRMRDTIYVFENFLYPSGNGRFYDIDFVFNDTNIYVRKNDYNDEIEVLYEKLLPWNINDSTYKSIGERVLGNIKHTIDLDISEFYRWVEESKEIGHGDTFCLCTLFIKEKSNYRLVRYPIWKSWLFYKMQRDYRERWYYSVKKK